METLGDVRHGTPVIVKTSNDVTEESPDDDVIIVEKHPNVVKATSPLPAVARRRATSSHETPRMIVISVGGVRHKTFVSTLLSRPRTRLWHVAKDYERRTRKNNAKQEEEYFFDRHPGIFASVIDYYRTGELHVPLDVCGAVIKRELDFWQLDDSVIKSCCWTNYSSHIVNLKALSDFTLRELETEVPDPSLTGWKKKRMELWLILDHPHSSRLAMGFAMTSFAFVLVSIAGFCVETVPSMYTERNVTRRCFWDAHDEIATVYESLPLLQNLDYLCTFFFTAELILRICVAPDKRRFVRTPMNVIDVVALLPLYVQIVLDIVDEHDCVRNSSYVVELIFVLRIVRIFRIFHLVRQYRALQILVQAMRASVQELLMLLVFLMIATLVFSTLIFYAERKGSFRETDGPFETIPIGFWWSIITMTTVGYGDIFPKTATGRVIAAVCAVSGVLLVALTIPVISNNFELFYGHVTTRDKLGKKKMMMKKKKQNELTTTFMTREDLEGYDQAVGGIKLTKYGALGSSDVCPLADFESITGSATIIYEDDDVDDNDGDDDDDDDNNEATSLLKRRRVLLVDNVVTKCSSQHRPYSMI